MATNPSQFSFLPEELRREARDDFFTLNEFRDGLFHGEQMPCWITHTTAKTHEIIRANLDKSPIYIRQNRRGRTSLLPVDRGQGREVRRERTHQIFLEREGRHTEEYYVNGVSTSLPIEVQYEFIRSIPGLEKAEIIRPGYAVEYHYCPRIQLFHDPRDKKVQHLYFAGQINGTSGYEEAAAQGLVAAPTPPSRYSANRPSPFVGPMPI